MNQEMGSSSADVCICSPLHPGGFGGSELEALSLPGAPAHQSERESEMSQLACRCIHSANKPAGLLNPGR